MIGHVTLPCEVYILILTMRMFSCLVVRMLVVAGSILGQINFLS